MRLARVLGRCGLIWLAAFAGFWAGLAVVPHFDHGGGSGPPVAGRDSLIGLGVTALMVAVPLLVPCCTSWVFLRRLGAGAASLWGFSMGVLLAPLVMAFMFGVREICDHPRSLCRGLDESILSVELLIIYVFAPSCWRGS
jgi:hypothetical protein